MKVNSTHSGRRALSSYPLKHLIVKLFASCMWEIHSVGQKAGMGLCPAMTAERRLGWMVSSVG